jgi:alpha-aminoadipate carrier protein LysW
MATCIACEAEVDTLEAEVGDTLTCVECGAEMEVISLRPLELELVDDADDDVDAAEPDDDDAADEEDDLAS